MAVPQHHLIRRFVNRPARYWQRESVAKEKTFMKIEYPRIVSEGHEIAFIDRAANHLYLLNRNPAWGTEAISRSVSYQLNLLEEEGGKAGMRVYVTRSSPSTRVPERTLVMASATGEADHKPTKEEKPDPRPPVQERADLVEVSSGIYGFDPELGF